MAGDGNYGGNGSVYWQVHHRSSVPQPLKNKNKAGTNAKTDHWIDLGVSGAMPAATGTEVKGHDPIAVASISSGTGKFLVHLYFSSAAATALGTDLRTLLAKIISDASTQLGSLTPTTPSAQLVIEVPAINRASEPTGTASDPWEVSVTW